jgi:hypothetical protein
MEETPLGISKPRPREGKNQAAENGLIILGTASLSFCPGILGCRLLFVYGPQYGPPLEQHKGRLLRASIF